MNQNNTIERINHHLGHTLGVGPEELTDTAVLIDDLNAAPEDITTLIEALETEFSIEIKPEDRRKMLTVGGVISTVKDYLDELED